MNKYDFAHQILHLSYGIYGEAESFLQCVHYWRENKTLEAAENLGFLVGNLCANKPDLYVSLNVFHRRPGKNVLTLFDNEFPEQEIFVYPSCSTYNSVYPHTKKCTQYAEAFCIGWEQGHADMKAYIRQKYVESRTQGFLQ